jgi:hypothetical protein
MTEEGEGFDQERFDANVEELVQKREAAERKRREAAAIKADKYVGRDDGPPVPEPPSAGDVGGGEKAGGDSGSSGRARQADVLIALASPATLFHTPDGDAFAELEVGGHCETHRVRGSGFRQWLRHRYYEETRSGCNSEALQVAIETLVAKAQFEGKEHPVLVRIAKHGNAIYLDVGDPQWHAIVVTDAGWKVVDRAPVHFARSSNTRPLPLPQKGSIELLRPFCNLAKDEFVVLVGHMLAILRPEANYPVLVMTGEQGSCKSTLMTFIVRLTDPRSPEQRSLP